MRVRHSGLLLLSLLTGVGCVHTRGAQGTPAGAQEVKFDEVVITGDLELEKLNDVELFAAGTSFYAAEDWAQAARYFGVKLAADGNPDPSDLALAARDRVVVQIQLVEN